MSEKLERKSGRKCSICVHPKCTAINSEIAEGKSFRVISRQFFGTESSHDSIRRHAENCLKLEIQALLKEKKIERAINHYQEITEQLNFARELRIAARTHLADPETGEIVLFPRADEITVIYEDFSDCNSQGDPKKKRDFLSTLLKRAEAANLEPVQTVIKHVDIRSFALDAIRTADVVLDKIAKLQGLYQKERENDDKLTRAAKAIVDYLQDYPEMAFKRAVEVFAKARALSFDELTRRVIEEFEAQGLTLPADAFEARAEELKSVH